jgi:hypothetical protein
MRIELQRVRFMPKVLEPGVLYYAEEYGAAAHLCACGCGTKVRTPVGATEWQIFESPKGVSLCPSVGNWQHPCQSHYWITNGEVKWSGQWTDEEVEAGRAREVARRMAYYDKATQGASRRPGLLRKLWRKLFR